MRMFEINKNENTVYYMMAYSNPPTKGYENIFEKLKKIAKDSNHVVFLSPYQDDFLNPLKHHRALEYNMRVFPNVKFYRKADVKNSLDALYYLSQHYNNIYLVTNEENIQRFDRFYEYASDWGVFEFEVIGLDTKKFDVEHMNKLAREHVINNDYKSFKKIIPSNDEKLLSKLYLELRKVMLGNDSEQNENDSEQNENDSKQNENIDTSSVNKIVEFCRNKNTVLPVLKEYMYKDKLGNEYLKLNEIDSSIGNINILLDKNVENFSIGKDKKTGDVVIFMNENINKLDRLLESKKELFEKTLNKAVQLKETTTAGSIANVASGFGHIIKRRDEDVSFVKNIKQNNSYNSLQQAMKEFIDKYGYIDSQAIKRIKRELNN
ncbi:hypothetical protein PBI_SCTP2_237 [Salicola phage SCTP-2]|nr:hypothetical protein PBI_SCTP2_237 [Salicola phage SCTP-2]